MNKLIGVFVAIIFGLSLIPLFISMTDDYNLATSEESFTAVNDTATDETVSVANTPVEVTKVTVNDVELTLTTEYTVSGSNVTVLTTNSDVDDVIVVFYTYELDTSSAQDTLVDLIPTLVIIMIVVGTAYAIKMKN